MLSVIIPSMSEVFLQKTISDILNKAKGEIEVIVNLDGYWPKTPIEEDKRVKIIHQGQWRGLRNGVNAGVSVSSGEYIMKTDEHCMFDEGFDEKLIMDYKEDNWVVVPRRKRLDPINWCLTDTNKRDVDYEFLSYPPNKGIRGNIWNERARNRDKPEYLIDDDMTIQGSCYFMSRKHWEWLTGLHEEGYGTFVREAQEVTLKTWLGGGRVVVNKKTWYAHLHKGHTYGKMYKYNWNEAKKGGLWSDDYWFQNRWKERKYNLSWLVEKFWPVPYWPDDRKLWEQQI